MLEIFRNACVGLSAINTSIIQEIYAHIENEYSAPGRYYHTMKHISSMHFVCNQLAEMHSSELRTSNVLLDHLTLATFFHDLVYDVKAPHESVKYSSDFAIDAMDRMWIPKEHIDVVSELVMITDHHKIDPSKKLISPSVQGIFIDSDNSILAAETEAYKEYSKNIYLEYQSFGKEMYRAGRTQFLTHVLTQRIFNNDFMHITYNDRAVENIKDEISSLSAG